MKNNILILPFLISALLASALDAQKKTSEKNPAAPFDPPLRAMQISRLEFSDRAQFGLWLKQLKSAGINTIIVKVFHNPGDGFHQLCQAQAQSGVYFQTDSAPVVCNLTRMMAQEAHKAGLKFYAWMNTRTADYGLEARTDLHSRYYNIETRSYQPGRGLCIFHPEVRARLINLYYDLAQNPIDGVLVQDDLILKHNEDFHPLAVHLYQKERGKTVWPEKFYQVIETGSGKKLVKDYTPEFWEWTDWKVEKLLDLADQLREAVRTRRPGAKFGMNFYYETGLKPEKGKAWFSQDLKIAGARNYDFYSLMLYHRQIGQELGISGKELDSEIEIAGRNFLGMISRPGEPVIKLMTRDFAGSEKIPESELEGIIKLLPERNRAGLVFFSALPGSEAEIADLIQTWEKENEDKEILDSSGGVNGSGRLPREKP